ncbi:MAG: hypothetical protein HYX63_04525 [Gammaproteobacteria bacterium]|nr:hypothetical protein [Gammaproteobacteria bacterium]
MRIAYTQWMSSYGVPALALLVLIYTLAHHLTASNSLTDAASATTSPLTTTTAPSSSVSADLKAIPAWHLFGTPDAPTDALNPDAARKDAGEMTDPSSLPPATVDLRLSGIAYSTVHDRAYAIIGTPDGVQKDYRIGDTITGDVTIKAILRRAVIITHSGQDESLALPEEGGPGGANPRLTAQRPPFFPTLNAPPPFVPQNPARQPPPIPPNPE